MDPYVLLCLFFVALYTSPSIASLVFLSPYILPIFVIFLGFGPGGIAAGSVASFLMSLGSGITPVIVSILQSIGAVGFSCVGADRVRFLSAIVVGGLLYYKYI